jgi:hypothetical protein
VFFAAQTLTQPPYEYQPIERPLVLGKHLVRAARTRANPSQAVLADTVAGDGTDKIL